MPNNRIFVISAPSGTGKTTLIQALQQKIAHLYIVVTHTTRAPRANEINGKHYHFVSIPEFENMIKNHELIEWAKVYEDYKGTSKKEIDAAFANHQDVILNIDWQGARHIRTIYPDQAVSIFIAPPSREALRARLKLRGDDAEAVEKRLQHYDEEMTHQGEYNHVILNDDFETALAQLMALMQ